ncbi:MAG: arginine/ornithine transport system permease protein [Gammaproteobacteria bacterium]
MDLQVIIDNLPLFLRGVWITVQLLVLALLAGLVIALPLGLMRASRNPVLWFGPWLFIWFFRGTPLLVQIYMIYHGFAQFEAVRESPWLWSVFKEAYWCAAIGFALNTAAYTAEILRGAIEQTAWGELEAARACGMSKWQVQRHIVLPGACRRALPAYGNEVIFMLHGTAVAGVITIVDLFGAAKIVSSRHFVPFESFLTAGAFYLLLTFLIVFVFKHWERRWQAHLEV